MSRTRRLVLSNQIDRARQRKTRVRRIYCRAMQIAIKLESVYMNKIVVPIYVIIGCTARTADRVDNMHVPECLAVGRSVGLVLNNDSMHE